MQEAAPHRDGFLYFIRQTRRPLQIERIPGPGPGSQYAHLPPALHIHYTGRMPVPEYIQVDVVSPTELIRETVDRQFPPGERRRHGMVPAAGSGP